MQTPEPASSDVTEALNARSNETITDWTGHPVSEEERQRILASRSKERATNSDDMNDMLDRLKMMRENRNASNKMVFRFDSDASDNTEPVHKPSAFEQAAKAAIPQDESMAPAYQSFGEKVMSALGFKSAVSGHGRTPVGEPDLSYSPLLKIIANNISDNLGNTNAVSGYGRAPVSTPDMSYKAATDMAARNITDNLGNNNAVSGYGRAPVSTPDMSYKAATDMAARNITDNLGEKGAVSGYGRAPLGHPDISYGPAIGDVSENFGKGSAVTGHGREAIGAPNMTYWQNWDDEDSRDLPLEMASYGAKQGWKDAQILFYSGASLAGEHLYKLVGGDDTSLRRVQGILDRHQEELKSMNRLTLDRVLVEGNTEKTMQNVTRYLYQELGNQTVRLPAYFILGHLNTFAQLFGVSSAVLSAQLYGDLRKETGDGHPVESVMYGVPLGLMSAALLPFRDKLQFQSTKEMKDYVQSFIVGAAVNRAQQDGRKKIVERYGKKPEQNL